MSAEKPAKILVTDDSVVVHKMMKKYLEPMGHTIIGPAKNGQEAVDLYQEHQPDMAFMDITMPIKDGIAALGEIKQLDPEAKVVMLSAMGDENLVTQARDLGATDFLQKPFDAETLQQAIEQVLGGGA